MQEEQEQEQDQEQVERADHVAQVDVDHGPIAAIDRGLIAARSRQDRAHPHHAPRPNEARKGGRAVAYTLDEAYAALSQSPRNGPNCLSVSPSERDTASPPAALRSSDCQGFWRLSKRQRAATFGT